MIIIDAICYKWGTDRMVRTQLTPGAYIEVREVERLLEEAHRRGMDDAKSKTA